MEVDEKLTFRLCVRWMSLIGRLMLLDAHCWFLQRAGACNRCALIGESWHSSQSLPLLNRGWRFTDTNISRRCLSVKIAVGKIQSELMIASSTSGDTNALGYDDINLPADHAYTSSGACIRCCREARVRSYNGKCQCRHRYQMKVTTVRHLSRSSDVFCRQQCATLAPATRHGRLMVTAYLNAEQIKALCLGAQAPGSVSGGRQFP